MSLQDLFISFWECGEATGTRYDSKGTNHLAAFNNPISATGKVGDGVDLERSSTQYLAIASNTTVQAGDVPLLLCGWYKPEALGTDQVIIAKYNFSVVGEYALYYVTSTNRFTFLINGISGGPQSVAANNFGAVTAGNWYFVLGWHDPILNTINICVNDSAVNSSSHGLGVVVSNGAFGVGGLLNDAGGTTPYSMADGVLDQVGFGKTVPTAPQITELYNSGNGLSWAAMVRSEILGRSFGVTATIAAIRAKASALARSAGTTTARSFLVADGALYGQTRSSAAAAASVRGTIPIQGARSAGSSRAFGFLADQAPQFPVSDENTLTLGETYADRELTLV